MLTPERFRDLVLDHVYDLLDAADAAAMQAYVQAHPEAQAEVAHVRDLLSQAAKSEFPELTFRVPTSTETVVSTEASRPPISSSATPLRTSPAATASGHLRWLVAAAALVLVGIFGYPTVRHFSRYLTHRQNANSAFVALTQQRELILGLESERRNKLAMAQEQQDSLKRELVELGAARMTKLQKAEEEERNKQIVMKVTGPAAIQSGAPSEFKIDTTYRNGQNAVTKVDVRVRDQEKNLVFEEKEITSLGQVRFILPADLPYKANTRLSFEVTAQDTGGKTRSVLTEELTWATTRYVTHLATDKPMYQPGQTIYFRSLTLNRVTMQPPEEDFVLEFSILSPRGQKIWTTTGETRLRSLSSGRARVVLGPDQKPIHGIGTGEYRIPEVLDGGEYTLVVRELRNRFPEEKRKVLVNKYKPDRLFKELDFHRTTYGPGDEVLANCKVSTEAGPVANKEVAAVQVNVDGQDVPAVALGRTDARGWVRIRCTLPKAMEKGNAAMTVVFTDGGARETIQKPIPVALRKLFVEFFPEGGQIVAGVSNRVYFQVRNTLDKPAELKGMIVDKAGKAVADVATLHDDIEPGANQGQGLFSFTPEKNGEYSLKILAPAGIEGVHKLPAVHNDGVVLQVVNGVSSGKEPIRALLSSPNKARELFIGAYCRGRMLASERVTTAPGKPVTVDLKPEESIGGVVRVTVFEQQPGEGLRRVLTPRAERLVFRRSDRKINLQILPDKTRYAPGDATRVTISATDEKGTAASAIVMVGVVNQQIITMADEKVYRSLPTHVALVGEVRRSDELEYADFVLGEHPVAAQALDLLLGVQGWRRFVEQGASPGQPAVADDDVERLFVMTGQSTAREVETLFHRRQEIESAYAPKRKDLEERFEAAVIGHQELLSDSSHPRTMETQRAQLASRQQDYASAVAALAPFDATNLRLRWAVIPVLTVSCIALALAGMAWAAMRGVRKAAPYLVTGAATIGGCVLLIVALSMTGDKDLRNGSTVAAVNPAEATGNVDVAKAADNAMPGDMEAMGDPKDKRFAPKAMMARGMPAPPAPGGPDRLPAGAAADPAAMMRPMMAKGPDKKPAEIGDNKEMAKAGMEFKKDVGAARGFGKAAIRRDGKGEADVRGGRRAPEFDADKAPGQRDVAAAEARRQLRAVQDELAQRMNRVAAGEPGAARGGFAPAGIAPPGLPGGGGRPAFAQPEIAAQPFIVREYAHVVQRSSGDVRDDQTETVYWHPVLVVAGDKKTEISFQLADEITRYRILVAGHTLDGRLGSATHQIESRKPFSLEAKLPREVTASDKIDLPVVITNDTDAARSVLVNAVTRNFDLRTGTADAAALLKPNTRSRRIYRLQPNIVEGEAELRLDGTSEPFASDSVLKRIPVVPEGYPVNDAFSDLLEKEVLHAVVLPEDFVKGTLKLRAQIYPSTLADLQKGLEGLLREPSGCFEQTSTSNYPNTLILNYLKTSEQGNPDAERRARELLQRGYQRLTSFECEKRGSPEREGYEWFGGQAPPHEALTAYGLMQFKDMAGVFDVDQAMVARTRAYLLSRRAGDGTFQRNARALDTFGRAPQHVTDAYIVWALTETGTDNLDKEIDRLLADHANSSDPYFLSLLGNALLNCPGAERRITGLELLKKVKGKQAADGGLDGAETSITHSGGRDLRIETTALAVLGWLKANSPGDFAVVLDRAVKWIAQQRGGYGGFGSTQSTILALKALITHTQANKKPAEGGHLTLYVNGNVVERKFFDAGEQGEIFIDMKDPERILKSGKNEVRLTLSTKRPYPYTVGWRYQTLTPASADKCSVRLATKLDKARVKEGDGVRLTATLENVGGAGKGQPMTIAIIGLPAGLKVPEDMKQLKELVLLRRTGPMGEFEAGPISFFEIRGRELVLYWRDVKPEAKIEVNIDLIAEIPGEYRGPASRAYLYYNADHKHWVKPLEIAIDAVEAVPE